MYITMSQPNLYDIMGVSKNASQAELKKQFRKLSMQYHPDRNKNDETSTKKYQSISAAYDVLSDEKKKRIYDMTGDVNGETNTEHMFHGGMPINPEEIFNMFTGGGLGGLFGGEGGVFHMNINGQPMHFHQAIRKPEPIQKVIHITLAEAYSGMTKRVEINRIKIINNSRENENETLYVTIPQGIDNNEVITIKDKGNIVDNNNYGDVKILIKVKNDTEFHREGIDLIYTKKISLKDALCGFNFDMKYIDGRVFKINNENGNVIEPGHKKIIRNMGIKRNNHTGNLTIIFNIKFPKNITPEKIKLLSTVLS